MTPMDPGPAGLCAPAPHGPRWEILRHRGPGRRTAALVLRDRQGQFHLHGSGRTRTGSPPQAGHGEANVLRSPAPRGGYDRAFHVRLGEHHESRPVALPTEYGAEPVDVHIRWWAHDPVQIVRTWTVHGWDGVREDLDHRIRALEAERGAQGYGTGPADLAARLAEPRLLSHLGLAYRVTGVQARDTEGELRLGRPGAGPPHSWTAHDRTEYAFCLQAVRNGPASLAALWLLRQPDQVSQVLDWSVAHQKLIRAESTWQEEMAALLGELTDQERQELSVLVRDRLGALGRRVPAQPAVPPDGSPHGPGGGGGR
jgi:hypothetical protein